MATIKHLSSKNSNYAAAESYLTFQHNEYTGLPILDEKGRPKLRDSYLLDTLECSESSFAMACLIANRKYGKNGGREDVKTHHYIISFDPKDAVENSLTMERAQALGLQFCKENFPGHPAIVCTHPDGHKHSGNIHVHIVIGSVRTREVERKEKQSVPDCWVSVKQFSRNDTATACQDWLRSTRLGRGSIKSHVRTGKVLSMGLFAYRGSVHLYQGVTH